MSLSHGSKVKQQRWVAVSTAIIILAIGVMMTGCGKGPATLKSNTTTIASTSAAMTTTARVATTTSAITMTASTAATTSKASATTTSKATAATSKQITPTGKATTEIAFDILFIEFDKKLKDSGTYYQKTWMAAQGIGAKEGYKYDTRSGTFELYLFDTNSDAYKKAVKDNAITLGGTLYPALIKNGLALYFYDNATADLRSQINGMLFS